jgi:SAM-dependent methyltransferase
VDGLLDDTTLAASAVVANSAMNRERQLAGPNSYARELGFDPLDRILRRLPEQESVAWLDLCCGRGRALLQAGAHVEACGLQDRVELIGVDLVDYFDPGTTAVTLVCTPATTWQPHRRFDLITVVHGLHYIGDKLGVLGESPDNLGADDRAGPNYTGQPAVHSYYAVTG